MTTYKLLIAGFLCFSVILLSACGTTAELESEGGAVLVEQPFASVERDVPTVGSRIKNYEPPEDAAVPVRVFDREDMRRTGSRSVGGFLGGVN